MADEVREGSGKILWHLSRLKMVSTTTWKNWNRKWKDEILHSVVWYAQRGKSPA